MKCKITYRYRKTLENTYEGVQFSEAAGLEVVGSSPMYCSYFKKSEAAVSGCSSK